MKARAPRQFPRALFPLSYTFLILFSLLASLAMAAPRESAPSDEPAPAVSDPPASDLAPFRLSPRSPRPLSGEELRAVAETLALLPDEFRRLEPIALRGSRETSVLGSAGPGPVKADVASRGLSLRRVVADGALSDELDAFPSDYLKRALVRQLALFLYRELPAEDRREWLTFSAWKPFFSVALRASNRNPDGFAAPEGMRSPALDFASFADEFFLAPSRLDPAGSVRARFPDRYAFFRDLFASRPDPLGPAGPEHSYRDWIDPDAVEGAEIIVTTPASSSIASFAGHILLLLRRKGDSADGMDSLVIGFVGEIARERANGVAGLEYAWRGITGHYRAIVQEETLEDVVRRATVLEGRDVQRLELLLSREELERLIERLWVVKRTFSYEYRFFDANCASMLLDAVNRALPPGRRVSIRGPMVPPMLAVSRLVQAGVLGEFRYPEYWEAVKTGKAATEGMRSIEKETLRSLADAGFRDLAARAKRAFAAARQVEPSRVALDPLFREPALAPGSGSRAAAYRALPALMGDIRAASLASPGAMDAETRERLGGLILRYLTHAVDREIAIAAPPAPKGAGAAAAIPADAARDLIAEETERVRLRRANTPEILAIREALSRIRSALEADFPGSPFYRVGRDMEEERTAALARERGSASFANTYYHRAAGLSFSCGASRPAASADYETALYLGQMGDPSFSALKSDMRLALLMSSYSLVLPVFNEAEGGWSPRIEYRALLAEWEKILSARGVDDRGFLSHGMGFTVLSTASTLWDGERFFPDGAGRVDFAELRYVLGIYQADGYAHYLDAEAGAGLSSAGSGDGSALFMALPFRLEGKHRLPGLADDALRFALSWESRVALDAAPAFPLPGTLSASAECAIGSSRAENTRFRAAFSAALDFASEGGALRAGSPSFRFSLAYLR